MSNGQNSRSLRIVSMGVGTGPVPLTALVVVSRGCAMMTAGARGSRSEDRYTMQCNVVSLLMRLEVKERSSFKHQTGPTRLPPHCYTGYSGSFTLIMTMPEDRGRHSLTGTGYSARARMCNTFLYTWPTFLTFFSIFL